MKIKFLFAALLAAGIFLLVRFIIASPVSADSGYTFTAPNNISFVGMVPRDLPYTGSATGTFTGNGTTGYTVTAEDSDTGTNAGHMVSGTSDVLQDVFQIGPSSGNLSDSNTTVTLITTSGAGSVSVPLYVSQQIVYNDPIANGYSITITYTVTAK